MSGAETQTARRQRYGHVPAVDDLFRKAATFQGEKLAFVRCQWQPAEPGVGLGAPALATYQLICPVPSPGDGVFLEADVSMVQGTGDECIREYELLP